MPVAGTESQLVQPLRAGWRELEATRRIELAALEILDKGVAEDEVQPIEIGQLLRSLPQLGEEAGDAHKRTAGMVMRRAGW